MVKKMYSKQEIINDGKSKFLEIPRYREIKRNEDGYFDLEDIENTDSLGGTFSVYKNKMEIGTLYQYKQKMYIINSNHDPIKINYKDLCSNNKKYDLKFNDKEKNEQIPVCVEEPECDYHNNFNHTTEQDKENQVILKLNYRHGKTPNESFIKSVIYKEFDESLIFWEDGTIFGNEFAKNGTQLTRNCYSKYGKKYCSIFPKY